jgi:DNA-binding transcriptional MerR regulator
MVDESVLTKLYYSIGEVAKMYKVNASLIRFWSNEFKQIDPKTKKNGTRLYSQKDIATLNKIFHLVKIEGHTLEGARKALRGYHIPKEEFGLTTHTTNSEVISKLESIKLQLSALKN